MDENSNTERSFGEVAEREYESPTDDFTEDTEGEQGGDSYEDSPEYDDSSTDDQREPSEEGEPSEEDNQEPKLTEKGTKLDPNPQSAVHQELANERRVRTQMEQVLSDPKLIARFVEDTYGIKMPVEGEQGTPAEQAPQASTEKPLGKKLTADDIKSVADVADRFNALQEEFQQVVSERDKKIAELSQQLGTISTREEATQLLNSLSTQVQSLSSEPELDPKSPEFIEGLEQKIGDAYHALDFDPKTSRYLGKVSLEQIGRQMIEVAREGRKSGVQSSQTTVIDKNRGKTPRSQSKGKTAPNTDKMAPGDSIAAGISKMFK